MNAQGHTREREFDKVFSLLRRLEERVERIEDYLEIQPTATVPVNKTSHKEAHVHGVVATKDDSLEFKIGEYWIARLGTAVLFMGVAFFINYPFETFPPLAASLLGYLAVAAILALSMYWKSTYEFLSGILFGGGLILLFLATLRLHFFNATPVIASKLIGLTVIIAVLSAILYLAIRRGSELLTGTTFLLSYATSLVSETSHFALVLITVTACVSGYCLVQYNWQKAFGFSTVLAFSAYLLWMMNNPLLGKPLQAVAEPNNILIFLFLTGTAFAVGNLFRDKEKSTLFSELLLTLINALGFFVVSALAILTFYKPQLALMNLIVSVFFLSLATINWVRLQNIYGSAIYALFGYLALTIAIFTKFSMPNYFIWLSWQSLLVVSTALWFRSRIIIVANFFIFIGILLAYFASTPSNDFVNMSYAIVALVSARILNWKKERLHLKTEMLRNAYLASAFGTVLYGLNAAVPDNFISLSWLAASLFYFAMSLLLKSIKYRWMAILTIFAVITRVFLVDMARLDAAFRIVFFVAIGFVLLAVSLLYTRYKRKATEGIH